MSAPTSGPRCLASVLPVSDGMVADWRRAHPSELSHPKAQHPLKPGD